VQSKAPLRPDENTFRVTDCRYSARCCHDFVWQALFFVGVFIALSAAPLGAAEALPGAVRGLLPRSEVPLNPDSPPMIVILGGTNAHEMQRHGYLETLLAVASPESVPRMRNLAWQADTVYRQQRPRNFFLGGLAPPNQDPDHRGRIAADTIVLWMGQNEALDARSAEAFAEAYADLVEQLRVYAQRLVLVAPVPFEDPLGLGLSLEKRNRRLAENAEAIRKVAREKHLEVVDLHAAASREKTKNPRTRDGVHLSAAGHWWVAGQLADGMQKTEPVAEVQEPAWPDVQLGEDAERLRQKILKKNQLWMRYWRPTNWAFLYGNRQFVESSRDHRDFKLRWFPAAVESIVSPIDQVEVEIQAAARQVNP
jgi:lysophospholipase L1-like esterase